MTYVRVEKRKFHYIYKTTCLVTGKYYIGMHSTDNLDDGYIGSGKRLRYSIRKYGIELHRKEILEFHDSRVALAKREAELIAPILLVDQNCMNLKHGGEGGQTSDVAQRNWQSPEYRLNHNVALKRSCNTDSYKKMRSNDMKARWSDDQAFISKALDGLSKGRQNRKPVRFTDEIRSKISMAKKNTGNGSANSQYGTCWIMNDIESKKIPLTELDEYLISGWVKGRKMK